MSASAPPSALLPASLLYRIGPDPDRIGPDSERQSGARTGEMPKLNHDLTQFWAVFKQRAGAKAAQIVEAFDDELATRMAAARPAQGDPAPEFALPDGNGKLHSLTEHLHQGPVVLVFFRGGWSPFCRLALRAYCQATPRFVSLGASALALSPQRRAGLDRLFTCDTPCMPLLSDRGCTVAERYGLAYELPPALRPLYERFGHPLPVENAGRDWCLPVPATFVIDRDRRVVLAARDPLSYERIEPAAVEKVLAALSAPTLNG